jgi:alcohol dehydrogenase
MLTTRSIVFDSERPRHLELHQFTLPAPAEDEAILRTELAGICGADHHTYDGWFKRGRVVPGHEFVGRIVALRGKVWDAHGRPLGVGDRVVPDSTIPCRRCRYCRGVGSRADKLIDYNACESFALFGSIPIGDPPRVAGGWSEYVQIPPNALLHRIGPGVSLEAAVLLEPLAVAVKAVSKAGVAPGDTVVVQGPGPVGLLTVVAAQAAGATRVILVGPNAARLRAGEALGASLTVNVRDIDPVEAVAQATGGDLAQRVIDASGATSAFQQGLDMTGRGGVYVNIGGFRPADEVTFRPDRLKRFKIDIRFSHMGSNAYEPALAIIESGRFPLEQLVTHQLPFEQAEDGLLILERREGDPIKIALTFAG